MSKVPRLRTMLTTQRPRADPPNVYTRARHGGPAEVRKKRDMDMRRNNTSRVSIHPQTLSVPLNELASAVCAAEARKCGGRSDGVRRAQRRSEVELRSQL
ncbi:hypothetical protein BD310DRAFT_271355 [Dichomitus squalens]|uniref:Uncharacterized protein n=1 Tax=Dichomitus squalens TaxID=114155 RepID=A0A4Q9Q1N6_9APHY|nr:hypothetical protein BD310DRAFT_271355 [Dichomitus squalens]